jgi:hypothetical protein
VARPGRRRGRHAVGDDADQAISMPALGIRRPFAPLDSRPPLSWAAVAAVVGTIAAVAGVVTVVLLVRNGRPHLGSSCMTPARVTTSTGDPQVSSRRSSTTTARRHSASRLRCSSTGAMSASRSMEDARRTKPRLRSAIGTRGRSPSKTPCQAEGRSRCASSFDGCSVRTRSPFRAADGRASKTLSHGVRFRDTSRRPCRDRGTR